MSSAAGSWWLTLAAEADAHAIYLESRGEFGGVERNKAASYRSAHEAAALTEATGLFHCACCLKPQARIRKEAA